MRDSLGLIDNRSYEDYIERYVTNVNAIYKKEKIKNKVTGKYEEPDKFFIKEFESNIHLKEDPDSFRSHILSKLGAYSLDHPGVKLIYADVLDGISKQLKESFRNEQKKIINAVGKNLVYYIREIEDAREGKEVNSGLSKQGRTEIETILNALIERHHYSRAGALNCLKVLITKRYELNIN